MAQGNMLLGMARGSVGDVTFARSARKQVSRARNRKPNNPRTLAQIKQRVLLKTAALAYGVLAKDIADQTFEGAGNARLNQQEFIRRNVALLRQNESATNALYAGKGETDTPINNYVVSKGSLRSNFWTNASAWGVILNPVVPGSTPFQNPSTMTYRQIADALGVPVGSQLTFIYVSVVDNKITVVNRFRAILAPASGDVDEIAWQILREDYFTFKNANPKNSGTWVLRLHGDNFTPNLYIDGMEGVPARCLIASSFDKKWRYSDGQIVNCAADATSIDFTTGNNFDDAVESWKDAGKAENEEYTRQAE